MTAAPLIALLGISGVGKSHLARLLLRTRPDLLRLSASSLLKSRLHTTGERLRTASGPAVASNQFALVDALAAAREGAWDRPVILEAHAVIDNDRELVDVPLQVMEAMGVSGILSLVAQPDTILARRAHDHRLRPERTALELTAQQERSRSMARHYAVGLNVPIAEVDSADVASSLQFVDHVLSGHPAS